MVSYKFQDESRERHSKKWNDFVKNFIFFCPGVCQLFCKLDWADYASKMLLRCWWPKTSLLLFILEVYRLTTRYPVLLLLFWNSGQKEECLHSTMSCQSSFHKFKNTKLTCLPSMSPLFQGLEMKYKEQAIGIQFKLKRKSINAQGYLNKDKRLFSTVFRFTFSLQ